MYRIPVYKVMLVRDSSVSTETKQIKTPSDATVILENYMAGLDREHFVVMLLDTKNRVIGINTISIGSLNSSLVHPREVFKPAILSNAAAIILAHNHPSGDNTPSQEDITVTNRIVEGGKLLGIEVLDHVILGNTYLSLREKGYMGT